ncbi:hypothetical protein Tco_0846922 [Tanacetum coccineum]
MQGRQTQSYVGNFSDDGIDLYDSDCDDISAAKAVLLANLSSYGSDVLYEAVVQDTNSFAQQDSMILSVIEQMQHEVIPVTDGEETLIWEECSVDKKLFEIEKKELKLENDRLLEHIISQDVVNIVMHADVKSDNVLPVQITFLDDNIAIDVLKMENGRLMKLLVSQDLVHTAVNSLAVINDYKSMKGSYIEEYERNLKLEAELSQMNELSKTCSRLEQWSQLQAKDTTIRNLKKHIQELKGKSVADCHESMNKPKVIALVVYKLDLEPLSSKLKNNREAHVDFIRITKENADTLRDTVDQARTSNPLDNALAYACMYTKQIQELLVYVSDTCPSSPSRSEKLVAVTPMNKARKVTFAKTSTTSENNIQKRVDLHKTQTTNKPLVPSTSVKSSTNASGSIPRSTTKNTGILQTSSSNQKYQRVEAHTRNVKSSLDKGNSMSKSVCSTCKNCLFDANHDLCVVNYLSDVNARARAKHVKSIKKKELKTTGKMFNNVGYKWVPTGRTFTLVGNKCPLTRFTSTKIVPPRKPVKSTVMKNIKPSSASQWRPRETKHVCSSSEPRIVEARTTNHLEPNKNRGSNVSISPCSSSVQCRSYKSYLGPASHRKEKCTLQCALSSKEEKSSYLRAVLSRTSISSHARSVNKWINKDYEILCVSNIDWMSTAISTNVLFLQISSRLPAPRVVDPGTEALLEWGMP